MTGVILLLCSMALSISADEPVAEVGGLPIPASAVARRAGEHADAAELAAALRAAADTTLLAAEARTLLGGATAALDDVAAAGLLERRMFDPGKICQQIPEGLRRERYEEMRWRFVAPPAFDVEDVQLLCCASPRACATTQARACVDASAAEALAVRDGLGSPGDAAAFRRAFELLAAAHPRLVRAQYRFYFDPERPEAPMDGRLQEVDRPVATAVGAATPGTVVGPVQSRFGHHLLWVRERLPAVNLTWDDPRTQALLRVELCPLWWSARRQRYVDDLRRNAPLRLLPQAAARAFGAERARGLADAL